MLYSKDAGGATPTNEVFFQTPGGGLEYIGDMAGAVKYARETLGMEGANLRDLFPDLTVDEQTGSASFSTEARQQRNRDIKAFAESIDFNLNTHNVAVYDRERDLEGVRGAIKGLPPTGPDGLQRKAGSPSGTHPDRFRQ